jgi:hypothetical protein
VRLVQSLSSSKLKRARNQKIFHQLALFQLSAPAVDEHSQQQQQQQQQQQSYSVVLAIMGAEAEGGKEAFMATFVSDLWGIWKDDGGTTTRELCDDGLLLVDVDRLARIVRLSVLVGDGHFHFVIDGAAADQHMKKMGLSGDGEFFARSFAEACRDGNPSFALNPEPGLHMSYKAGSFELEGVWDLHLLQKSLSPASFAELKRCFLGRRRSGGAAEQVKVESATTTTGGSSSQAKPASSTDTSLTTPEGHSPGTLAKAPSAAAQPAKRQSGPTTFARSKKPAKLAKRSK